MQKPRADAENPELLSMVFLSTYTASEGLAEEIGFHYLRFAPLDIVGPLLMRTPWPAHLIEKMLKAVMLREKLVFTSKYLTNDFDLVAEWRWANRVRNDLAHSHGRWNDSELWELVPRSPRHQLRELTMPMDVSELLARVLRLGYLWLALNEVAVQIGAISFPETREGRSMTRFLAMDLDADGIDRG